jgi:septal ring factor EnvC (AmiA/AmiB activator)
MSPGRPVKYFLILLFLSVVLCIPAHSAKKDLSTVKDKYREIQKELKTKKEELKRVKQKEKRALNELHRANRKLVNVSRELKTLKMKLLNARRETEKAKVELTALEDKISERKGWLKRKLRSMHRRGRFGDVLLVLGSSDDFSQAMRRWRYVETLAAYERQIIEDINLDLKTLNEKQLRLKSLHARLQNEKNRVMESEKKLKNERKNKQIILSSVRKKSSTYNKLIEDLKDSSNRLLKLIKSSEMASKKTADKGFRRQKGRLSWPVNGNIAIPYGSQKDPRFKTPIFRNGIYIAAKSDDKVKAAFRGEVVYADWFKGYGQLIILNHGGGYHTLYANLAEIFLKTGDIIKDSEEIGTVGSSGLLNRPSLYFEIRYKGKPLNPSQWLERKIARKRK